MLAETCGVWDGPPLRLWSARRLSSNCFHGSAGTGAAGMQTEQQRSDKKPSRLQPACLCRSEGYVRNRLGAAMLHFLPTQHTCTRRHTNAHKLTPFPQNKETMEAGNVWTLSSAHHGNTGQGSDFCSGGPPACTHTPTHTDTQHERFSSIAVPQQVPAANHREGKHEDINSETQKYTPETMGGGDFKQRWNGGAAALNLTFVSSHWQTLKWGPSSGGRVRYCSNNVNDKLYMYNTISLQTRRFCPDGCSH